MEVKVVETSLQQLDQALRAAIDASLEVMATDNEARGKVYELWEKYLGEGWGYLKQKSQEKGLNPLAGFSYARLRQKITT
ncbi:hypothetical protein [Neomoorella thermoacetica]|uniref:Uncharacterized protein n=2 Tax=Neomoorella thermoacetica TaxID=1525 RepID=A0A1J5JYC0_NEOTH|nr:hypothetical protein [Moorella thermoacetica]APC07558.1 hypothetical protein MTJW_03780 [Moorella thermoacetica]OIQ08282.1 hypothetical protein MOOR_21360 [Moorella thermoacetica]OIQ11667.1 hypothetical protein MOOTH_14540 [Moorella thermoacetica]OIQ60750.1 hypothetical protein MTIN_16860 [Moorella thermoacetica]GAF26161.1 FKBP-type peptidyl-prolyl cis-trans isomerases 1 [Moorella thermoacetica Y72]